MYCVKCGVKLADTEKKCPLCNTKVYHPDFKTQSDTTLYPAYKMPQKNKRSKALHGAIIFLFIIPMLVCYFADKQLDNHLEWFGYVVGALTLLYVMFFLPFWFDNRNPVIFVPCDFLAIALFLFYVNRETGANWFLTFALPIIGGLCLIITTVITLVRYIRNGRLYMFGGGVIALAFLSTLIEYLSCITFDLSFIGWSHYPFVVLLLVGGLLIYFAINSQAREMLKRKLFF